MVSKLEPVRGIRFTILTYLGISELFRRVKHLQSLGIIGKALVL